MGTGVLSEVALVAREGAGYHLLVPRAAEAGLAHVHLGRGWGTLRWARSSVLTHPSPHQLFVDKDTIVNAVGASHDIHLLKIDNREDELVTRINSWCTQLVDKVSSRGAGAGPLPLPPPREAAVNRGLTEGAGVRFHSSDSQG